MNGYKQMGIEQVEIREIRGVRLTDEELDHALHECMTTMWKNYRESATTGDFKPYNSCFHELYEKFPDLAVQRFIQGMGMGLVEALNRRIKGATE